MLFTIAEIYTYNLVCKQSMPNVENPDVATSIKGVSIEGCPRVFQGVIFRDQVVSIRDGDLYLGCIFENVLLDFDKTEIDEGDRIKGEFGFSMCSFRKVTLPDGRDLSETYVSGLQDEPNEDEDEELGWESD